LKERPIPFRGPMVRAILAGRKTQTRRIVKGQDLLDDFQHLPPLFAAHCPYGQPGDRLWVKETFAHIDDHRECGRGCVVYRADPRQATDCVDRWRSARFMPRKLSRLTLEVTEVRVERLQAISEADATAEGIGEPPWGTRVESFGTLWDEINGKRAPWASDPWVWVVAFRRSTP
jgi:hypothetical protein